MMCEEEEHNPWIGRGVRFVLGAVFGVLVGLYWGEGSRQIIFIMMIVCGVLAALFKDEFWEHVGWWW